MGEAELDLAAKQLRIHAHLITYGNAADATVTERIRDEIETMWNEPQGMVFLKSSECTVSFHMTAAYRPDLEELEVYQNTDPRNNYFRIEEYAHGNISFVDGVGSNSGYFKLENLYPGSTTAAHEFGHTLGLDHPHIMDLRGSGTPGIMYPRGTLVDPHFQYDPAIQAGITGGTMHPMHRKVLPSDIQLLQLDKLRFRNNHAVVGAFTNIYHWDHAAHPFIA
jgi:hypothetical protein